MLMRNFAPLTLTFIFAVFVVGTVRGDEADDSATGQRDRPIRALLVTGGCCHDYDRQKLILTRGISARANVRWTVVHQGGTTTNTPIPLYNDPDWAEGFDIVVHNECFSDVTDLEFVDRILKPHREGLPAILIHCAMHCYRVEDDRWFRFVGMQSPGHGPHYSYKADNVKPEHPIMKGFGPAFIAPKGELYHSMKVFETATPLAQANRQADEKPQVCVWTNDYDGTRVFGCTMGHYNETMAEPKYLDMMARAVLWATERDIEAGFTPSTEQQDVEIRELVTAPVEKQTAGDVLPGNCCGDDNLALGKPVTSKSVQDGNFRKHLTDGRLDTRYCPNGSQTDEWCTVDLGTPQHVRAIRLHWERRTGVVYKYVVEVSEDNAAWRRVVDYSTNDKPGGVHVHEIKADDVRFIRTTFLGASKGLWGSIWELEATAGELPDLSEVVSQSETPPPAIADVKAPQGFAVSMFGAPPEVNYPVCLTAAATGEVFVGVDEMGSLGKEPGRGKVLRCIDADGDGRADRICEFAKMDHPRGLIFDDDSLWVLHPPFLSVFHDNDGDGVADESEVLIEGISTEEVNKRGADHTTNGIRMGIDGWIYIAVGDYGFVRAVAPKDGTTLSRRGGGIVRIRPDGTEMEIYSWGQRNILDVSIDPYMNIFTRDNTNDGGGWDIRVSHILQSADYGYPSLYKNFSDEIMPPLADYGGGSGCGSMYFHDERWPDEFRDLLLTCDWGTSKVYSHALPANGATFDAQQEVFLSLPRPTDIDVDGSGRMYVSSWKNGRFAYDGPNVGFVAQVLPSNFTPKPFPDLPSLSDSELVAMLASASAVHRQSSQRELIRRHAASIQNGGGQRTEVQLSEGSLLIPKAHGESVAVVETVILAFNQDAPLYARAAAVFTLKELLGPAANDVLVKLTQDEVVAEFALRALSDRKTQLAGVSVDVFLESLSSSNPRVQSAAVIGLGRLLAATRGRSVPDETCTTAAAALLSLTRIPEVTVSGDRWRAAAPGRVIPHLAVKSLVRMNAVEACLVALRSPYRHGAVWALKSMHNSQAVDGLFQVLSTSRDDALRKDVWTVLIRLYHREGEYRGGWWGTRPDTTGPYYDRKPWSESPRIAAAIKVALSEADKSLADHILSELKRHVVRIDGVTGSGVAVADEPEAKIELPKVDPNNPNLIANLPYAQIVERVMKIDGDAEAGAKSFKTHACVSCHTFANGQLPKGPHLVDIGKRYKKAELVESIVEPSRKIAQGFDTWTFIMESGRLHTGFVVQESAETVLIRMADGLSRELLQDDIEERVKQTTSMMPKGVVGNLTCGELADLIAFLQSLH